jgi:hypothetical protein
VEQPPGRGADPHRDPACRADDQRLPGDDVPKILTAAFLLIAIGPWMMGRVTGYATSLYLLIPTLAG